MRHKWDYSQHGKEPRDMLVFGRRVCLVCGETQRKHQKQDWGRVIGYQWDDDGRKSCPGPTKRKGKKK